MHKRKSGTLAIRLLMLIGLTAALSSFSIPLGMDSYKVYLNDKLLFKQYVNNESTKSISLNESAANDQLIVYYDHCGRIGTSRSISLLDGDQELKKWTFKDTESVELSGMPLKVSDIRTLQKPGKALRVMYNANELAGSFQITSIAPAGTNAKVRL